MIRLIPAITLLIVCTASCTVSQRSNSKIRMETYQPNRQQKKYKNLLIVAEGSLLSRTYIENIVWAMKPGLEKAKLSYHYEFLGNPERVSIENNLKRVMDANPSDALLHIRPMAAIGYTRSTTTSSTPNSMPYASSTSLLRAAYSFELTEVQDKLVWGGRLTTNIPEYPRSIYPVISKKIIAELKENKLLPEIAAAAQ
ncbi:hypothetical protein [Chitinophaga sp. GbtcB8]|uniref:hypothetical protein n=1 Tax=Chitinophaga sp. GbtcB8 TaxID=2824753 RepID=UPI001C30C32D|nr:hypothetical protein [Chitinophaga sp. GbtcB8]